jgi:hypothetical protein
MTTTFENAKVGDRVYSLVYGFGKIRSIGEDDDYPIEVDFDKGISQTFQLSGKYFHNDENALLFWDKPTIIAPEQPKPAPVAPPVDMLVEVRDFDGYGWKKQYSAGMLDSDGWLSCWDDGRTSKTAGGRTCEWKRWRIVEDNG